jgi:predicted nucleic acid-binding Zn ribbon protein
MYFKEEKHVERVGELVFPLLKKLGLLEGVKYYKAVTEWNKVVGKEIANHTKADKIKDRILYVLVDDPLWKQELEMRKEKIMEKFRPYISFNLKDIKFMYRSYLRKRRNYDPL